MVRRMCGVSLKNRKRSVDLYSLLGVQGVADVVRRSRLRWFGHLERRSVDDWVSTCKKVEVAGAKCNYMLGGGGRLGKNAWIITWKCLVYILNGQYSVMCGGTSYGQTSNASIAWEK